MDYGGSPWGDETDDSAPAALPPSPRLPSFTSTTAPASSWGNDAGGGWGTAVDDFPSYGPTAPRLDVEVTTEDIEAKVEVLSSSGGGWGDAEELPLPTATAADLQPPRSSSAGFPSTSNTSPPPTPLSPPTRGFAPSPPLPPLSPPPIDLAPLSLSDPSSSTSASSPPPADSKDDDWGDYGTSPKLPPIALQEETASGASRDTGWGGDDEWQPAEVPLPLPLPTFGTSFGGRQDADEGESSGGADEGWGGASAVPSWSFRGAEQEVEAEEQGEDDWEPKDVTLGPRSGKSLPAALVDNLKTSSREFADATWTVPKDAWGKDGLQEQAGGVTPLLTSLLEPPLLPPSSSNGPITNETPLPSLFRLTPTLYPAFNDGLAKTALRATETLKGTSSSAYRNARFGTLVRNAKVEGGATKSGDSGGLWDGASSLATPVLPSERGRAGDEFDLDRPGQATNARSSWWGASGGQNATTNMPSSMLRKKEDERTVGIPDSAQENAVASSSSSVRRVASPTLHPEPGTLGRLWGRLKRPTTVTPEEHEPEEWSGGDLNYLDRGVPVSKIAQAKQDPARMDDSLGSFFGDAPAQPSRRPPRAAQDEFGGLRANLSKPLDPFDPFADDDDEYGIATPISATSPTTQGPASIARVLSPPPPLGADVLSFPPIAAPQARGVSSITTASADDSFDSFFSSFAPTPTTPNLSSPPPPLSRAASTSSYHAPIVPTRRNVVSPPLRTTTNPPPLRVATISPPTSIPPPPAAHPAQAAHTSPSMGFFAPPPPPTQPLRGFSGISPPPSASVPSARPPPVAAPPPAPRTAAVGTKTGGPLSMDDLSFFES